MKVEVPAKIEGTLSELLAAVFEFRRVQPKAGSADMIQRIEHLIELFDSLKGITLSDDINERTTQIAVLFRMREVKRDAEKGDWDWLGKLKLLYPAK